VVVATSHQYCKGILRLTGKHQTKDIIKDIKQKIIVTKIDLLEIGITFYFLPMVDQILNQIHKVGHHKKSPSKKNSQNSHSKMWVLNSFIKNHV
jgi:hypothetical protein